MAGQALPHPASLCSPSLSSSSAPEGCTTFGIRASPGVVVDVVPSPPAKRNPTGSSKWPLAPGLEVSVTVRAASSSTGDQKVSVAAVGWWLSGRRPVVSAAQLPTVCPALTQGPTLAGPASP